MNSGDTLKICGLALLAAISISVVKRVNSGFEAPMRISATVVFFSLILGMSAPVVLYASSLISETPMVRWQSLLLGAVGVAFMSHAAAQLCRDCGENGIAECAELAGKAEILLLCLPLLKELLEEVESIAL